MELQETTEHRDTKHHATLAATLPLKSAYSLEEATLGLLAELLESAPEEEIGQTPGLCFLAVSHHAAQGETAAARRRLGQLAALRDSRMEGSAGRGSLTQLTACAAMMLPQGDNARLLPLLSAAHHATVAHSLPPVLLSATGGRPSVLRGSKDLSQWGQYDRAVCAMVRPLLQSVLPGAEAEACAAAVAELLYEKNDLGAAATQAAQAAACGNEEIAFAGYGLLARIAALDSAAGRPDALLAELGSLLEKTSISALGENYRALGAMVDLTAGRLEKVRAWVEQSPEGAVTPAAGYRLIARARALLALGQCREAAALLEQLLRLLREDFRPLDTAECRMLQAVAQELLGDRALALENLALALAAAAPYGYIRVIADGGPVVCRLLEQLVEEDRPEALPGGYLEKVADAARAQTARFPWLFCPAGAGGEEPPELTEDEPPELTEEERRLLVHLQKGKTNKQIAAALKTQVPAVKAQAQQLYQKLGAPNRAAALAAAKAKGLI